MPARLLCMDPILTGLAAVAVVIGTAASASQPSSVIAPHSVTANVDYTTGVGDSWQSSFSDGQFKNCRVSPNPTCEVTPTIKYQSWDGKIWEASIGNDGRFFHWLHGQPRATGHESGHLNYVHPSGLRFTMVKDGVKFRHFKR